MNATATDLDRLVEKLRSELKTSDVYIAPIEGSPRVRINVVADQFEGMPQMERQDLVWSIMDSVLGRDAHTKVTIILAFAPSEVEAPIVD